MRVVIYTAILGPHAPARPSAVVPSEVRYVCFTDRPFATSPGWESYAVAAGAEPRLTARRLKTHPETLFPEAAVTIWMDASFVLLVDPLNIVADAGRVAAPVVGFVHPDRRRMTEEATQVIRAGQARRDLVDRQRLAYQTAGFDTDDRPQPLITTTGLLVRQHTPAVATFNDAWWREIVTHTVRDQLSIDYCAWHLGMPIGHLPGSYRLNRYARYDVNRRIRPARVSA